MSFWFIKKVMVSAAIRVLQIFTLRVASGILPAMFLRFFFHRKYYSFRRCFDLKAKVRKIAV